MPCEKNCKNMLYYTRREVNFVLFGSHFITFRCRDFFGVGGAKGWCCGLNLFCVAIGCEK